MRLVIVESPNKCSKIQEILGPGYKVMASVGHIRDLPEKQMGITGPNFVPAYEITKPDVVKRLQDAAARAECVYLATDPDREGEAIAWHLAQALGLKNPQRITYQSVTKEAIHAALGAPRPIDMHLVQAQECRRVTDRLVGYKVSPILNAAFQGGTFLTAGRVQSAALRVLVEREAQIKKFVSVTHYGVEFHFTGQDGQTWRAAWDTKPFLTPTEEYILDKGLAERIAATVNFRVATYEEKQSKEGPQPPFTTTTLQKAGEKALGLGVNDIMALAQKLFEGGHITYMRTDSPALSHEALAGIAEACQRHGFPVVSKARAWKAKEGAQEAHEAIRPTHFENLDAGDTEAEKALYQLIWRRAVATQVADAVYAGQRIVLAGVGDFAGKELLARASSRRLVSPGWRAVYNVADADDETQEEANNLPVLKEGADLVAASGSVTTKKTAPPKRYTQSGLVDVMERYGIGRPSTYGATVAKLLSSGYVSLEKKNLVPTPQGVNVVLALTGRFSFVDFDFTKKFEELLDDIAQGKKTYLELTSALDTRLQHELKAFTAAVIPAERLCPDCGHPLKRLYKPGKPGGYDFFACNGCQARYRSVNGKPGDKLPAKKGA